MNSNRHDSRFRSESGIFVPVTQGCSSGNDFNEDAFEDMLSMQRGHFWYFGRHRFLLKILKSELTRGAMKMGGLRAIDLGGGCGGWVEYLHHQIDCPFEELALGDGSKRALALAEPVVGTFATRYCIDLLNLPWREEWDVVFLLDVLEHIPDHVAALREVRKSLRPGGIAIVAAPALKFFWSYNDDLAGHQRRYSRADFASLAREVDMQLLRADYFMFFLSPALFLSRMFSRPRMDASAIEIKEHLARTHRQPPRLLNALAGSIFSLESHCVDRISLPWGTSIVAVLKANSPAKDGQC